METINSWYSGIIVINLIAIMVINSWMVMVLFLPHATRAAFGPLRRWTGNTGFRLLR